MSGSKRKGRKIAECVCGVFVRDQAVLVEKRRDDDEADPDLVMLPGGHVEIGESLEEALRREMIEELGVLVEDFSPIRVRYYTASNGERQRIHYYRIKNWNGTFNSNEAERIYWESELENMSDAIERDIASHLLGRR